ncbi:MAG: hypothetical protein DRP14_03570 [Candidatus Aenigmatarchaeota archaeon]|nr:MAG: hypothetical protein DRP14_03570 [Candidatus Aenigmarchaeota archaeon]
MYDFFETYFINPVLNLSGYNWINSITYAIILIIAIFLLYKFLKYLNITIDGKFALSLLPYIFLGSILRVLRDANFFTSPVFVSPLIYILVFLITLPLLLFSLFLEKRTKIPYQNYFFSFGFILSGIFFTQIKFVNFIAAAQILSLDLLIFVLIFSLGNLTKLTKSLWNKFAIFSQLFDASSTFVSVQFWGYSEQHVLPNLIFGFFGNWSFFLVKFIVVLFLLYFADSSIKNKNFKNWLKLVVIILGLALGTRDLLRISALV